MFDAPMFDQWDSADRILVTTNLFESLAEISDVSVIQAALALAKTQSDGWGVPEDGVPIASVKLNFYQGERFLGHLGITRKNWIVHMSGGFWSKKCSETPRMLEVLKMDDDALRW